MSNPSIEDREPKPLAGLPSFEEGDFHGLAAGLDRDPQYDDRRLVARRKLATLAKQLTLRAKSAGLVLDQRTSLHRPTQWNGNRVGRLWAYSMRPKAEKTRLRKTLGADLAKDLDAAYRNAYLCLAIEPDALEVSFRIHADAWFDGQNLVRRVKAEGQAALLAELRKLDGFTLKIADWRGEWPCEGLEPSRLKEFLGYYVPGEHALAVEQRFPAPAGARGHVFGEEVPEAMLAQAERLFDLYRWAVWSKQSDFLFG
jgi:hypothetical protein